MTVKKNRKTLQFKLYSIFIVSVLIPVILTTMLFSVYYYNIMMHQEKQNIENILNSVNKNVETNFAELMNIGNTYYMQKDVFQEIESLNNPKLYEFYDDLMMKQLENNYSMTMTKLLYMSSQKIRDVVFFPINSEEQMCYYLDKNSSRLQAVPYPGYEDEAWFTRALDAKGTSIFYPSHMPAYQKNQEDGQVYSCVRAILNMDNKKAVGVIKIDADIDNLKSNIDVIHENSKDGMIMHAAGHVLAKTESLPADIKLTGGEDGNVVLDGKVYYQRSVLIPSSGWTLTYLFSMDGFVRGFLYVILAACVVVVLVILLAFVIYRKNSQEIVEDVAQITGVLKEVEKGNLEVSTDVRAQNELQEIGAAVDKMIYNLREYIDKEYLLVISQQKAEFMALQSQINPHFLYNTLNGFIALNRMGEKKKLEQSIISLTHLFRYTCTKNDIVTIGEELKFLKEYLGLEKLKYDERLDYIIWMDERCGEKKIPKLLLQPVVENSIIHGMGDTDEPVMITIMVHEKEIQGIGSVLIIDVRDNGAGYEQGVRDSGKEHVGLENIQNRIELYNKQAIYRCSSTLGKGTKTTIIFPEKNEGDQ